jgi:hypothetical protein
MFGHFDLGKTAFGVREGVEGPKAIGDAITAHLRPLINLLNLCLLPPALKVKDPDLVP